MIDLWGMWMIDMWVRWMIDFWGMWMIEMWEMWECEEYVCGDWAPRSETELGRESQMWPFIWNIYIRVRSGTKLGRESQEWPQICKKEWI